MRMPRRHFARDFQLAVEEGQPRRSCPAQPHNHSLADGQNRAGKRVLLMNTRTVLDVAEAPSGARPSDPERVRLRGAQVYLWTDHAPGVGAGIGRFGEEGHRAELTVDVRRLSLKT